jgi:hypothetical protein
VAPPPGGLGAPCRARLATAAQVREREFTYYVYISYII